jgi:hypothetical protein
MSGQHYFLSANGGAKKPQLPYLVAKQTDESSSILLGLATRQKQGVAQKRSIDIIMVE